MSTTITTTTKHRSIEDDMTSEEQELFTGPLSGWGDAEDAAARGAAYLDRVMPGWADQVELLNLDLSSPCQCVLGQLFKVETQRLRGELVRASDSAEVYFAGNGVMPDFRHAVEDGFAFGIRVLGLRDASHIPDEEDGLNAAYFFGFDYTDQYTYHDLQQAWEPIIESRKTLVDA